MCQTCGGKGYIHIGYRWGYGFAPCPDSYCDYDVEEVKRELGEKYEKKLKELKERQRREHTDEQKLLREIG